jgi:hypothetical protein
MSKARKPWRHRAKRTTLQKTPAEKAEVAAKRHDHRVSYCDALSKARGIVMEQATQLREQFGGHTVEWYFEEIMQQACKAKSKRETSRWNAFLRDEVKHINDGKHTHLLPLALPAGEPRQKSSALTAQISVRWKSMSKNEQIAAMDSSLQDLNDQKEMCALSLQNVAINAFHDVRANMAVIKSEVKHLPRLMKSNH